jgi:PBSX family phage terminase large subunit
MPLAPFSVKAKTFFQRDPAEDKFFTLLEGSVRSGKTWAMMVKILSLNFYKVRGQRVLIGNSKESIRRNVLVDLATFVGKKNYRINMQSGQMWLYGVEWLVIGVSNEGSERAIRGMTAGIIVWDEVTQAPKNVFDMAMSRLSPEGARFYGTTNPGTPYHYLLTDYLEHKDFIQRVERIKFNLEDNLSLSEETRQRFRSMFHGVFYQRNILGLWVIAEGAIYRDSMSDELFYDDDTRPIGLLGSGGYVDRFVPIDYGTANQTVFLDVIDDGKTYWVNDEWVWDSRVENLQKTDKQYADELEEWLTDKRGALVIVDPSAASFKVEMTQRGIYHCDAVNDVLDGIRTVSSLLAQRKIRIHKRCTMLTMQLQSYSWDEKAAKRGEEKPLKENDHTVDAIRYGMHTRVPEWRIAGL